MEMWLYFKSGIYLKIKHRCGIKEMQKIPFWFFFTVKVLFCPVWVFRIIFIQEGFK